MTPRDDYELERAEMVRVQIAERGVRDPRVLAAMTEVPRHCFVPAALRHSAYDDGPLPLGRGQTISQPYIVAAMTELLELEPEDRVLDIGTGSGYQAAVLAEIVGEVYSIEIVPSLADEAADRLASLGYDNVTVRVGDGYRGWPEKAPFDGIVVAAAADEVPPPLKAQLANGGRLVIPVGALVQELRVVTRTEEGFSERAITGVAFVPMTGEARRH